MEKRKDVGIEVGAKCWDVFIKLISAFTVVVTGAMLFGKYIDQQASLQENQRSEMARELSLREADFLKEKLNFDKQQDERARKLLGEAKTIVARLANSTTPDRADMQRFEELYHADLIGVEIPNGLVEKAMVNFRNGINGSTNQSHVNLRELSLQLSEAVESELDISRKSILAQHQAITKLLSRDLVHRP